MSAEGSRVVEDQRSVRGQYAMPVGLMFGLVAAAVLCLGYAWLHHDPKFAVQPNPSALNSMLWRTTIVVAVSAVLTIGSYLVGGLYRQLSDWRARFFAYISPALLILATSGAFMMGRGSTKEAFDEAASAQQALIPFDVTAVARWAWWCACLAVVALALVAIASYNSRPGPRRRLFTSPILTASVALVVVVIVAVSVVATRAPAVGNQTASRIDAPTLSGVGGQVAYRVQQAGSDPVPAGAGFVRVIPTPTGRYSSVFSIEGYDGSSGQRRWTYGPVDNLSVVGATGIGPDSVVLAQSVNILIGIDATTGTPLWFKRGDTAWDIEQTRRGLSPGIIVAARTNPNPPDSPTRGEGTLWEALSPRTGEVLWTKTFGYQCWPKLHATQTFVVARSCETPKDAAADVFDARTGASRTPLALSTLGINPADVQGRKGRISVDDVQDGRALVTASASLPERVDASSVMDIETGQLVRHLPARRDASFIDDASVLLSEYRGQGELMALSIIELPTGQTIPVGFADRLYGADEGYLPVTRLNSEWWTLVPTNEAAKTMKFTPSLRSIDAGGQTRDVLVPCPEGSDVPGVTVIPGALLVNCGHSQWAAVS